jgi:hypothetical protein
MKSYTGELTFYNEEGRIVKKFPVINESSSFNISDLAEGIYFVRLTDSKLTFLPQENSDSALNHVNDP